MKTVKKKYIIIVSVLIAALIVVLLYSHRSVKPGVYVYRGTSNQESWLELNRDGTFRFDRAIALNYVPWGNYKIENGACIAEVSGSDWVFVFDVIGDNKLRLSLDKCSESGRKDIENLISDGAIFEHTEASPWTLDYRQST